MLSAHLNKENIINISTIEFKNAKGELTSLSKHNAKAYLIVNTASKCGLTPQYDGLQALYSEYKSHGLEILAFPSNEFLAQEPGTDEEIQSFCKVNFGVEFPINKKIIVKGEGQHPLYKALTEGKKEAVKNKDGAFETKLTDKGLITGADHDIHWNFEKFLVNAEGEIIERFFPDVAPMDEKVISELKKLL